MLIETLMETLVSDERIKGRFQASTRILFRIETEERKVFYCRPTEDNIYLEKEKMIYYRRQKDHMPPSVINRAKEIILESDDCWPFFITGEAGYFRLCIYVDVLGTLPCLFIPRGFTYKCSVDLDREYPYFEWPNL